jgi:hypothetical protein
MREASANEPLMTHRKDLKWHQNRGVALLWEKHGGNLRTGHAVSGVHRRRKLHRWLRAKGEKKPNVAISHSLLKVIWSVLKHDRPYVEPDVLVLKTLEREKQIRHHAQRLRQFGADEQAIATLMKNLLEAPKPDSTDHPWPTILIPVTPHPHHGRSAHHRNRGVLRESSQATTVGTRSPGIPHSDRRKETKFLSKI